MGDVMFVKSCTPSGSRNLCYLRPRLGTVITSHRLIWHCSSRPQEVPGVVELVPPMVTTCYHLSSCLLWLDLASTHTTCSSCQSERRAASGMNKLSIILMCMFSYIWGKGFGFWKNLVRRPPSVLWLSHLAWLQFSWKEKRQSFYVCWNLQP